MSVIVCAISPKNEREALFQQTIDDLRAQLHVQSVASELIKVRMEMLENSLALYRAVMPFNSEL